jgi:hypothetical protein
MPKRSADRAAVSDYDRLLRSITPRLGDPTYSLLKAHLCFEEILNVYLDAVLPHPSALAGSRLSFAQLLAVARSSSPHLGPDDWQWRALSKLNKLRNMLAHNLAPEKYQREEREFIDLVISELGAPMPSPEFTIEAPPPKDYDQPLYLAVDMAVSGLFGSLTGCLGLSDPTQNMGRQHAREP